MLPSPTLALIIIGVIGITYYIYTTYYANAHANANTHENFTEFITASHPQRNVAASVCKLLIDHINVKTKLTYVLNRIDQLNVERLPCGAHRFVADLFVHEMHYKITRRLLFDFIVYPDKRVVISHVSISNAYAYSDSAAPGENPTEPMPELILKDWNLETDSYHIEGVVQGTIPYSLFELDVQKRPLPNKFRNWILPIGVQETDCVVYDNSIAEYSAGWDTAGIPLRTRNIAAPPMGTDFTANKKISTVGESSWLFNKARGMLAGSSLH